MQIKLNPITKEEIHKLANTLLIYSILRPEIIEKIKDPQERLTWVDSLAVAAYAIAMQKAGKTISDIADAIGRTEATVRRHLSKETEAGKIVWETYEKLARGEEIEIIYPEGGISKDKIKEIVAKLENILEELKKLVE